jgi:GH24 family phage-related lysozyme (muramidase)
LLTDKAQRLILDAEGLDQPSDWPGGDSGITIGVGYDLGYVTEQQFRDDWGACLSPVAMDRLVAVVGLKGQKASDAAAALQDIKISLAYAEAVFLTRTVPEYEKQTVAAFPGAASLPPDAYGALVSLVYNRGTSMDGDRRREMRAIRDDVPKGDLKDIAAQLRSMKRLWVGKGQGGLIARREAEAKLVESCIPSTSDPQL